MATYDDVLTETNFIGESSLSANRFTFPDDGLIRRWPFFEGDGNVNEIVNQASGEAFVLYNTNGWLRSNETGRYGVSTKYIAGTSTSATTLSATKHSLLYSVSGPYWFISVPKATLSMWVSAVWSDYLSDNQPHALYHFGGFLNEDSTYGFDVYDTSSSASTICLYIFKGLLYFYVSKAASLATDAYVSTSLAAIPDGPTNIIAQWDGSNISIYVNGKLKAQTAYSYYPDFNSSTAFRASINGTTQGSVSSYREYGGLDATYLDLAFWNRDLAPTEILAVYNDIKYSPVVLEMAGLYSYASYPVESYVESLIETFYHSSSSANALGVFLLDGPELISLVGYSVGTDSNSQYHDLIVDTSWHSVLCTTLSMQYEALVRAISLSDMASPSLSFADVLSENVWCAGIIKEAQAITAIELVRLSTEQIVNGEYNINVLQKVSLNSVLYASWLYLVSESINATDQSTWRVDWIVSILEKVKLLSPNLSTLKAIGAISTAIAIHEASTSGLGLFSAEEMTMEEVVFNKALMWQSELIKVSLDAGFATGLVLYPVSLDKAYLEDDSLGTATLQEALDSGVSFAVNFGMGGQVYSAYVMNTKNFALSEYQNFPFNSFAKVGHQYYAASETGLYLLDGPTDAGEDVQATITLGAMDFTGERKTNVCEAFLALRNDGEIAIKVKTDDNIERWYRMSQESDVLRDRREKFARGVTSRFWTFSLENIDGADFEVHEMTFLPLVMKRRI